MENKKDLWLRLRNYDFDDLVPSQLLDHVRAAFGGPQASTRAFADKLSRKLHWSGWFALRAIDEYRKFLYLGQIAPFPVTPPKVIDQVWHEHLLFTRGYREFCARVLGRDFDHHPELVPVDEQTAAFQAQYDATRELYRSEFDHDAPGAFWGIPKFAGRPRANVPRQPRRRFDNDAVAAGSDTPLYAYFGGEGGDGHSTMPEFGGGASGGGGGGGSWPDSSSSGGDGGGEGSGGGDSGGGGSGDGGSGCPSGCSGGDSD